MPNGSIRTLEKGYTGKNTSEVRDSHFDPVEMPALPRGIRKDVRQHANDLLAANTHLWQRAQVYPLLRLATLYADLDRMNAEIDQLGLWITAPGGEAKVNPMLAARDKMMATTLSLERQLGVTFVARDGNVKRSEQRTVEFHRRAESAKKVNSYRPLKLA